MPDDNRVQIRIPADVADWLSARADRMNTGSAHLQARHELVLWRAVLDAELARLRFTIPEAMCLADVLNSPVVDPTVMSAGGVGRCYAEAFDAFRLAREAPAPDESSYAAKWGIDESDLLDRLSRLGPAADHALLDAIAQWWADGGEPTAEGFHVAGVRVRVPPNEVPDEELRALLTRLSARTIADRYGWTMLLVMERARTLAESDEDGPR